jgi:ribonuclease P protein component
MNAVSLPPARAPFPRTARVRARAEYGRVIAAGRRCQHPLLALHVLTDAQPARLGLAVSRKVDPRAVGRNRIKRALRDHFRKLRAQLPPGAYVLVARAPAARAANPELRAAFDELLRRAAALPAPAPLGTMRTPGAPSAPASPPPSIPPPRRAGRPSSSE